MNPQSGEQPRIIFYSNQTDRLVILLKNQSQLKIFNPSRISIPINLPVKIQPISLIFGRA